ncbi:hypothetical protein ACF0H5_010223 [Mactra antiquata]
MNKGIKLNQSCVPMTIAEFYLVKYPRDLIDMIDYMYGTSIALNHFSKKYYTTAYTAKKIKIVKIDVTSLFGHNCEFNTEIKLELCSLVTLIFKETCTKLYIIEYKAL